MRCSRKCFRLTSSQARKPKLSESCKPSLQRDPSKKVEHCHSAFIAILRRQITCCLSNTLQIRRHTTLIPDLRPIASSSQESSQSSSWNLWKSTTNFLSVSDFTPRSRLARFRFGTRLALRLRWRRHEG